VPSEWTTMLGRRLRKIIQNVFSDEQLIIPIAGLSNVYIDYITTFEEYLEQRYEGSSNVFGPLTESIMLKEFHVLATNIKNNIQTEDEDEIADLSNSQVTTFIPS